MGTPARSYFPLPSTRAVSHSSPKFFAYSAANAGDGILTMTFSSRVHESFVQFMEPVQTVAASVAPSRTMYLWCIRSGTPDTGLVGTPRLAMKPVSACDSGRVLDVVGDDHEVQVLL